MIDWQSSQTHLLLNPRLPEGDREVFERLAAATPLPGHVWLATSGTTGALKLVALSKQALLASAAAVNRHLEAVRGDVWACVLPEFHVGGLGIHARAYLSGGGVVSAIWSPTGFARLCAVEQVTLSSLVPTQVADLLEADVPVPSHLRAIIVGGGALSDRLWSAGIEAGWPLLPSYGMTECGSQIATSSLGSRELGLLDHLEARIWDTGRLAFRGASLLSGVATAAGGFCDPKVDGWFVSEDVGKVDSGILTVIGRDAEFIKVGGESVDLSRLQRVLESVSRADAAVLALPDARLGHVVVLAVAGGDAGEVCRQFNASVLPFERVRRIVEVDGIPRTELGKIRRDELRKLASGRFAEGRARVVE